MKKSGFCFFIKFNKGIKQKIKINKYESLLLKKPDLFQLLINLKNLKLCTNTFLRFSSSI